MKKKHHEKLALLVYGIICNIPVSFCLAVTAAIISNTSLIDGVLYLYFSSFDWGNILLNFAVGFTISMCITLFIPLSKIGKWFTGLFKIKNITYTGNIPYRLLSTFIISFIFFIIISPSLTILNAIIYQTFSFQKTFIGWCVAAPFMFFMGFVSSLFSDMVAYHFAHKVDSDF